MASRPRRLRRTTALALAVVLCAPAVEAATSVGPPFAEGGWTESWVEWPGGVAVEPFAVERTFEHDYDVDDGAISARVTASSRADGLAPGYGWVVSKAHVLGFLRLAEPAQRLTITATFHVRDAGAWVDPPSGAFAPIGWVLAEIAPSCEDCLGSLEAIVDTQTGGHRVQDQDIVLTAELDAAELGRPIRGRLPIAVSVWAEVSYHTPFPPHGGRGEAWVDATVTSLTVEVH